MWDWLLSVLDGIEVSKERAGYGTNTKKPRLSWRNPNLSETRKRGQQHLSIEDPEVQFSVC